MSEDTPHPWPRAGQIYEQLLMESIRCGTCRKLLAKAHALALEIKCPRCGTLNHWKAESLTPERPRASLEQAQNDAKTLVSPGLPSGAG